MGERLRWPVLCLLVCAAPLRSQPVQVRRATMNLHRGGAGKCVVEVEVEGAAEVELFGDTGSLRTLRGPSASWRRLECTGAMPANPAGLRFAGVAGRGHQELLADPRWNGGVAVVRIDHQKPGREVYTFGIGWSDENAANRRDPALANQPRDRPDVVACQDAVRTRARGTFGYRDIRFYDVDSTYNQQPRDFVSGTFEGRRGGRMDELRYTCALDGGVRVESVDLQMVNGDAGYDGSLLSSAEEPYHSDDVLRRCERAVSAQLSSRGYDAPQFRWSDSNDSGGRIDGFLSARRGSREESLDFSCLMDEDSGKVKSVDLHPH